MKNKFHLISGKEVVSFQKISTPGKLGETTVFFAVIPAFKEQKQIETFEASIFSARSHRLDISYLSTRNINLP